MTSLKPPWWHWGVVLAIACIFTAILFTRCCGQRLSLIAPLLIFPYVLGSLVGGSEGIGLEIGFAVGAAIEFAVLWWMLRAAVILGKRGSATKD